jgi:MFS family permease
MLLVGVGFMAASFNIAMPTTMGLLSKISSEDDQGGIMGIASAMISMATVIGPIVAGGLFSVSARGSYAVAACLAIVVAAATVHNMRVFKIESALAP